MYDKKPGYVSMEQLIREATATVEDELKLEDANWLNLSSMGPDIFTEPTRKENVQTSRLYYLKDPLARQAIRLWTDYTFGSGMTWDAKDEKTNKILSNFWNAPENRAVLSSHGQRKSSDKLLVDGEVFFALFLGAEGKVIIRRINPLEITELITDPEDLENVLFYKRAWSDVKGTQTTTIYRSIYNKEGKPRVSPIGENISHNDEALVYHVTYNTIGQRGNPLMLAAIDWIKQYRRFLASRVAIMLALARFAWKSKVKGGAQQVAAMKAVTNGKSIPAGSTLLENLNVDTTPIKTETGASEAYYDGRMIKLQIAAAFGIPEQYFGDISIGNLATAKTVELPMMKMFQSYQQTWMDVYQDIDTVVLDHNEVKEDKRYVDRDFPEITPTDVAQTALALLNILQVMPELAYLPDIQQIALLTLGVDDPGEALKGLDTKEVKTNLEVRLLKAIRAFRESLEKHEKGI